MGMRRPPGDEPDPRALSTGEAPPSPPAIRRLFNDHWEYVFTLLISYGVEERYLDDVAKAVWVSVNAQIAGYDAAVHVSPRAWLTGFIRNCAALHLGHAKGQKAPLLAAEAGDLLATCRVSPEQAAALKELRKAIPDEQRREAFLLRYRYRMTIEEIAAAVGVAEGRITWWLALVERELESDKDKKARSFLGYGSLEALAKALQPQALPPRLGADLWDRIEAAIRQQEGAPLDGPRSSGPPSGPRLVSAMPLVPPLAPPVSGSGAGIMLAKTKLAAIVAGTFLLGAGSGAGGHAALSSNESAASPNAALSASGAVPAAGAPSAEAQAPAPEVTALPVEAPPAAAVSVSSTSVATSNIPDDPSARLLWRMETAVRRKDYASAVRLAEQHAQNYPAVMPNVRERMRIQALVSLGRTDEAERRAREVVADQPRLRPAMERALGRTLP